MKGMPLPFQRRPRPPRRPRPISNWVLFWAFAVVLAGGWFYYSVQADLISSIDADGSAEHDIAITQLRVDTVRNTLTVAAGLGGAAALVLSFRRQQHDEYHSTQQRITELRIQAVAQLGSESPTVRIGGLHNLERLGEEYKELRQIVLDEVCAYLRMPSKPDADDVDAAREVSLTAQEVLQRKLKQRGGRSREPVWAHYRLNLRNAYFATADFADCHLSNADFSGATFSGDTNFRGAVCDGISTFDGAAFMKRTDFLGARFTWSTSFTGATFAADADFYRTRFEGVASFGAATFGGGAKFTGGRFAGPTEFDAAVFTGYADFYDTHFTSGANFKGATLAAGAGFGQASFGSSMETRVAPEGWQWASKPESSGLYYELEPDPANASEAEHS